MSHRREDAQCISKCCLIIFYSWCDRISDLAYKKIINVVKIILVEFQLPNRQTLDELEGYRLVIHRRGSGSFIMQRHWHTCVENLD